MDKDKAVELAEILLAYAEGKTIQSELRNGKWKDIVDFKGEDLKQATIERDGEYLNLRIKPEPKLVPFTFKDNLLFRDKWVRLKNNPNELICRIISFDKCCLRLSNNYNKFEVDSYSYESLLKNFIFEDGHPCGKLIND